MDKDTTGTLDEALERVHSTGPEFRGWLSNHAPMAVEALVRNGFAGRVHPWLDVYVRRLEELPRATTRIEPDQWREALGNPQLLGEWLEFFGVEMSERPWRDVLATWWPRLVPGIAAGATHGVIRTGHAVRVLLDEDEDGGDDGRTGPRTAELGQALGYWAARWQPVPGVVEPSGRQGPLEALGNVPAVPDQERGIDYRLGQLGRVDRWPGAVSALRPAHTPEQARVRLAEVAYAATVRLLTHGHGDAVMQVHSATAPTAVLRTLPALPERLWVPSLNAAWAAGAAVTAAYEPAEAAPAREAERLVAEAVDVGEVLERAAEHGDEHAIKLADTAAEVFGRTGDPTALAAAVRGLGLIPPAATG
ncbi:questin oxidase family protein [Wenjunlia tyrosinilytica]|uniref:DUF4243 domain-containing protein n=1 Tax=Wenjunlia tyrosinilytica TaxID=1544741 RepID=A0A917ZQN4_9ACTN|nr:questin oxidase family protein [Wenjunlia tyrosinilytica]GGO89824.1 hypothetical protein GCM10012280_33960 [Wenjunlia tyrosinilytica]